MTHSLAFMNRLFTVGGYTDPTVLAAKRDMESIQIPTRPIDIFDQEKISWAKALFSEKYKEDPTPGFGFGDIDRTYNKKTLEGYWVDKHLSSRISIDFIEESVRRIKAAVDNQLYGSDPNTKATTFARDLFFMSVLQRFGQQGDPYVKTFKELNVEISFIQRIVDRLRIQEQQKLFQEIPLPPTIVEEAARKILIDDITGRDAYLEGTRASMMMSENSNRIYEAYCKNLFDLRDQRMVAILEQSLQKDKEARQSNPHAPLTNLVTIASYESDIEKGRKRLYFKIGAIALGSLFFFVASLYFRNNVLALLNLCKTSWSLYWRNA